MAGIINHTARQFNLKCIGANGNRTVVRLAPGFNVVDDEHWKHFVNGKKIDSYVAELKKKGSIEFGAAVDDLELEQDPDTKAKSKSEPLAKLKSQLEEAEKQAKADKLDTEKATANAREATARADKAELELIELKKNISKSDKTDKDSE